MTMANDATDRPMTVAELGDYARAGLAEFPENVPATGMRPEHAALLNNALGHTRTLLTNLAETCEQATHPTVGEEN